MGDKTVKAPPGTSLRDCPAFGFGTKGGFKRDVTISEFLETRTWSSGDVVLRDGYNGHQTKLRADRAKKILAELGDHVIDVVDAKVDVFKTDIRLTARAYLLVWYSRYAVVRGGVPLHLDSLREEDVRKEKAEEAGKKEAKP